MSSVIQTQPEHRLDIPCGTACLQYAIVEHIPVAPDQPESAGEG